MAGAVEPGEAGVTALSDNSGPMGGRDDPKGTSMNAGHNPEKNLTRAGVGLAAAVLVAPVVLFAGAGTAQAAPFISYTNDLIGTIAHVSDPSNPPGAIEFCNYHSNVAGQPFAFPFDSPVQLDGPTPSDLQIPGIQTGTTWAVRVSCPVGGTQVFTQKF